MFIQTAFIPAGANLCLYPAKVKGASTFLVLTEETIQQIGQRGSEVSSASSLGQQHNQWPMRRGSGEPSWGTPKHVSLGAGASGYFWSQRERWDSQGDASLYTFVLVQSLPK